ncbi:MAG TPA: septation protein SepH [Candidatus Nanopelagicaceae bacterium]
MTELRLTGKSTDGAYLNLTDGQEGEYTLRISDTLRASVNQPRLAAVRVDEGQTISVREIQARLRSGEPIETLAREANCAIDKIERFAGPIVQERAYIIGLAQEVVIRKESGREPVTFLEVVTGHLAPRRVDMDDVEWNTWRIEDGSWIIRVNYPNRDGIGVADWSFESSRRALAPLNDGARWIVGEESTSTRSPSHGLVYGNHPSARLPESRPLEGRDGPRLVAIRETPDADAAKDGVTGRAKVPSWDEIMFGTSKPDEDESDF